MIRIAISVAAFEAIAKTLPLGSVAVESYFRKGRAHRLAGGGNGEPARRDARAGREL
jgi:hypothetical protein